MRHSASDTPIRNCMCARAACSQLHVGDLAQGALRVCASRVSVPRAASQPEHPCHHCALQAQRAELDALLLRQRTAEAQRQRQRAERQAELARMQLELATQHMAACEPGRCSSVPRWAVH